MCLHVRTVSSAPQSASSTEDGEQGGQPERRIGRILKSKSLCRRRVTLVVRIEGNWGSGSHGDDSKASTTCHSRLGPRPDCCRTLYTLGAISFRDITAISSFTRIGLNAVVANQKLGFCSDHWRGRLLNSLARLSIAEAAMKMGRDVLFHLFGCCSLSSKRD